MPSDSIAGFLDQAQAVRVLFPEQIEQLIRQPDVPQSDLSKLCEYLLTRGVVTRFQAEAIRDARGQELNFAGLSHRRRARPMSRRHGVQGPTSLSPHAGRPSAVAIRLAGPGR